jgi:hypothetical protein
LGSNSKDRQESDRDLVSKLDLQGLSIDRKSPGILL